MTVALTATIQDITAATGAAACDAYAGDIRNETVTFVDRNTNTAIASGIQAGLVNAGDSETGTASFNWTTIIGNADSVTHTIGIIVDGYFTRNS